jgi:hypothetical protein
MIFGGLWYYKILGQQGINFSYKLLVDVGPTYAYSHFMVA